MAEAIAVSVAKAFWWGAAKAGAKVWVARAVAQVAFHVSQIAITAAISYGISAATRPRGGASLGGELDLQVDADFPRQLIVGTRAVAGSLVAHFSTGPNNNNLHLVYALADHPCVALKRVWADGRIVRNSPLSHGVRTEITAYSYSGGPRVWFTWWDGRPGQVASSGLITASGGEWTTDHKGAGVAYVHVELQIDSDILTSVPRFLWEVQGAKLYNRRKDSTSGGSGSHRLSDPSTWEYSENVMDAAQHYLLGYKVENEDIAFGVGLSPDEIPYAKYAAEADLCDEDVVTGTGGAVATIKRYAANGVIGADQFFEDVLIGLQTQMGGRLVDLGGRIAMIGAEARTPVLDLTDEDWDVEDPVTYEDRRRYAELFGAVEGRYVEPANIYQPAEIERQEVAGLALPDGGEAQTQTLELGFETNPRRAARLARMWLEREQRQARLSGRFGPKAYELEPGDWFNYSSDIEQLTDAKFEVIDIVKHEDFTVTLTAQAVDPDIVAFDNDNDPDLSVPGWIDPESLLLAAPTFTVAATSLAVSGSLSEPAITFTLTSTDRLAREIVIEWRRWISGALENVSYWDVAHTDQTVTILRKGLLPTTDYKVRAKVRAGRKESPWSDWSSVVTTPAISFDWSLIGGTGVPASGATRNALSVSATAPSSPVNGDLWLDTSTTPNVFKVRQGGAWVSASSLGGVFGSTLFETSGGAAATLSNFKTALGTAAAITGQGALATRNTVTASVLGISGDNFIRDPYFLDLDFWLSYNEANGVSSALANGSGTGGTAGWYYQAGTTHTQCPREVALWSGRSGPDYSAAHRATLSGFALFAITPGRWYEMSFRASNSANQAIQYYIEWFTVAGAYISGNFIELAAGGGEAKSVSGRVQAPSTAAFARPMVRNAGGSTLSGFMAASGVSLREAAVGDTLAPGAATFGSTLYRSDGSTLATDADYRTGLGTAAAIIGQGWGATASESTASNAYAGVGANLLTNADFARGTLGWLTGWDGSFGGAVTRGLNLAGFSGMRNVLYAYKSGSTSSGDVFDLYAQPPYFATDTSLATLKRYGAPVKSGDRVFAAARLARHRCNLAVLVRFADKDGAGLSEATVGTGGTPDGAGNGDPAAMAVVGGFVTAPSNAAYAGLFVRVTCTGEANPYAFMAEPMLGVAPSGQLVLPPWSPGVRDQQADRSSENTAAAITGQGSMATQSTAFNIAYAVPATSALSPHTLLTTYQQVASRSITIDGGPVDIDIDMVLQVGYPVWPLSPPQPEIFRARLKRGSTTLLDEFIVASVPIESEATEINVSIPYFDASPGAGTHTYTLELRDSLGRNTGLWVGRIQAGARMRLLNPRSAVNAITS